MTQQLEFLCTIPEAQTQLKPAKKIKNGPNKRKQGLSRFAAWESETSICKQKAETIIFYFAR